MIKKLYINSFKAFEIIISVFILRRIHPVLEIIIHRNGMRSKPEACKLNGKPVGEGCLSRWWRTCYHHKFHSAAAYYIRSYLGYPALLKRLLHKYHIFYTVFTYPLIEISHGIYMEFMTPFRCGVKRIEKLLSWLKFIHAVMSRSFRKQQHETVLIFLKLKIFHPSCWRQHISVIVIPVSVQIIHIHGGALPVFKEPVLITHSGFPEYLTRFIGWVRGLGYLYICFYHLIHEVLYFGKERLIYIRIFP